MGSDDAVFEAPQDMVDASPINVSAERFDGFLGLSPSRRARLPSSETAAAPDPDRARKPPLDAGFLASGAGPRAGPNESNPASEYPAFPRSQLSLLRSGICCRRRALSGVARLMVLKSTGSISARRWSLISYMGRSWLC